MRLTHRLLLLGEKVPEGGMRGYKPLVQQTQIPSGTPHPSLRATFSLWEKGQFGKDVKNNGTAEVDAKYDAPMGEWV